MNVPDTAHTAVTSGGIVLRWRSEIKLISNLQGQKAQRFLRCRCGRTKALSSRIQSVKTPISTARSNDCYCQDFGPDSGQSALSAFPTSKEVQTQATTRYAIPNKRNCSCTSAKAALLLHKEPQYTYNRAYN